MTSTAARAPGPDHRELQLLDAYWRAANYLSVGQIFLLDNPLLREPLRPEHVKPRLLGHFGTVPGLNLVYAHLNRVIRARNLNAMYVAGPGHGGPGLVANAYLEGTYTEVYPSLTRDVDGLRGLFRQFSFPGGIPSHVAPETPGGIHEGGELGYALSHAYGAAFDNPDLLVACVIGDGEAETGPLAASWHSNKWVDAARDGAVLPILHLNGYKIANPTVLARIPEGELVSMLEGFGHSVHLVAGDDPAEVHLRLAATLDAALDEIARHPARRARRSLSRHERATALADDRPADAEGLDRAGIGRREANGGQLAKPPGADVRRPRKSCPSEGPGGLAAQLPTGGAVRRCRCSPVRAGDPCAGGRATNEREPACQRRTPPARPSFARLPRIRPDVPEPGATTSEATRVLGELLRDVIRLNHSELPAVRSR